MTLGILIAMGDPRGLLYLNFSDRACSDYNDKGVVLKTRKKEPTMFPLLTC